MADDKNKLELNIRASINTDTIEQDFKNFDDPTAPLISNTGIERDGGITNIYETETEYTEVGQHIITDDGKDISIVDSATANYKVIKIDGKPIGQASSYGVEKQLFIEAADDVFLDTNSYTVCSLVDNVITVTEYDYDQVQLNTRSITFTNLASVLTFFTSLSFIRYNGIKYSDSLEFALRLGDQIIILQESNPGVTVTVALQSSSVLGTSTINASVVYNNTLVVAGDAGKVGSFDGTAWKNWDGSGTGVGVYNNGDATLGVVGSSNILSLCVYTYLSNTYLVVGGVGGRVGSWNGTSWVIWSSGGLISNNATAISTDAVNCMIQWNNYLVIAGSVGKLASWSGTAWTNYNVAGVSDNATLIGAVAINSIYVYTDIEGNPTLVVGGASGRVGALKINTGTNWAWTTTTAPGGNWNYVAYGNGLFVAVAITTSTTAGIATSPNGVNWTFTTTPAPGGSGWGYVTYGNGIFVALALTTSTTAGIATSPDGFTWTFTTLPSSPGNVWTSITYGNGIFVATAGTTSTTAGIATSPDGVNWTFTTTTAPGGSWTNVTYGNGLFVALAGTTSTTAGIATSTNGTSWTFRTTTAPGGNWDTVVYGNGIFVAVARALSTTASVATSSNGTSWTFRTTPAVGGLEGWTTVTYGNGLFVLSNQSTTNMLATSLNGINWAFISFTSTANFIIALTYGNGVFVGLSSNTSTTRGIAYSNSSSISKLVYTTANTAVYPTNNGTAIGANAINVATQFNDKLVVAGDGGRVASFDGVSWNNYNSGVVYSDNATIIGSNNILSMVQFDNKLIIGGAGGRLGSINADGTKNIYTSGTPISSNATLIGANNIRSMVVYNSQLIASGVSSTVNSMSTSGASTPFYNDGGVVTANLLTGFNSLGYLYVYRYENGYYHINLTGNSLNKAYTLNNSTKDINTINCRYSIPQVSNGVTRHIVSSSNTTARPIYDGSSIKCTGLVGYTDFTTFSGTVQYPTAAYVLGNGFVLQSAAGFGYSDFTFRLNTSATSIYNYVPQFQQFVSGLYQIVQSNTNTLVNAYGKLTNNLNLTPTKPFEFRVGMINGVQAYLSTAILDGIASDALGTIITNVGEFDDTYSPMIKDDDKILYLYNNKHIITKIGINITDRIQKVDTNIYKLNSISPLNIVDPSDNSLRLGSMDYNGRMLFTSSTSPTVSTKIASVIQGKYSNSIDVGDKLVTIVSPTANNVEIIGYRVPVVSTSVGDYSVDTYFNDIYSYSTLNDGSELIVSSKVDTIYVSTTILPTSLGVEYKNGTAQTSNITIFLKPLYDGYSIGNDIIGNYDSFVLFGQLYLFDGNSIYLATVDEVNGIFSNKTKVTGAIGLKYLAVTSTEAYFYSSFDNSLYTFSGGRDLNKFKRMNRKPIINSGIYSTVDNTLLFDTDTSFIWVRDNIITENLKGSAQTNLKYYSTTDGIIIGNDVSKWQYTYYPLTGSVTVPLSIQTSYYGFNLNDKSILSAWVITIYNENKDATSIKGTCYIIDDDTSRQQPINWTINPRDYVDGGYARIRVQPENQRSLGTSLKLETNSKIILVSIVPEFIKGETAVVAKARSR